MTKEEKIDFVKNRLKVPFLLEVEDGKFEEFSFTDLFINGYSDEQLLKFYEMMKK